MTDRTLLDEPGRLLALRRYEVLDTPHEAPFDRIANLVQMVLEVPIALVSLIDADRQWMKSCVGIDVSETPRDVSFCTHTIQAREPMVITNACEDPRFANNPLVTGPPHIASYLGVPLATPDGYNLGSLCAIDTKPRSFTAGQIEVMKSFAALVMNELEQRQIAQMDFLTGTATRRAFCHELEKAISRSTRSGRSSALLMLDIDHFKAINDTFGHAAGDRVLKAVSGRMEELARGSDLVGRLGGEEFGILLADAGMDDAVRSTERLRAAIEELVVEDGPSLWVTASFGIAVLDGEIRTAEDWLAAADQAMYEAKRSGRNRWCVAPEDRAVACGR